MRHKKKINHLSRKRGHRQAMLSNMASSLIIHKRITTTTAKAKALRMYVEPLISRAKEDSTHSRRVVFNSLQDKEATNELFREVATKVGDRPGGYTRIIKIGNRQGDNADMCIIELVDYNENLLAEKAASKSSRRRRGKKKPQAETVAAPETAAVETGSDDTDAVAETVEEVKEEEAEAEIVQEVEEVTEEEVDAEVEEKATAPKPESAEEVVAESTEEAPEAKSDDEDSASSDDKESEKKKEE